MFLRSIVGVLALVLSLSVSAGAYQCKKGEVSAPCDFNAWSVGGDALYVSRGITAIEEVNNQGFLYDPNWGLRIAASRFFGTGNDFTVNWVYLTVSQDFIDNTGGVSNIGTPGQVFNESSGLSWVNVELGQAINVGASWHMRVHGGLLIIHATDDTQLVVNQAILRDTEKANAMGVRVGTNINYNLLNSLDLYIDGAAAIGYSATRQAGPPNGVNNDLGQDIVKSGGVLAFDFGIGLNYTTPTTSGDVVSRIGWVDYAFSSLGAGQNWQGLIFGAKWVGNA